MKLFRSILLLVSLAGLARAQQQTGWVNYLQQASAPSPITNATAAYVDSTGRFSWVGANGFVVSIDGTGNSASRIYTLPDVAGTFALVNGALGTATITAPSAGDSSTRIPSTAFVQSAVNPANGAVFSSNTITWTATGSGPQSGDVTLTGNVTTFTMTGWSARQEGTIIIRQDGTGSRTLGSNLPSGSKVGGGGSGSITLSTAAGSIDILTVKYGGTNYFFTKPQLNYN